MKTSPASYRRNLPPRRGASVVEFAVLLPFLLYLCVIATDWARLLQLTISLKSCAQSGAMYASDPVMAKQSKHPNFVAAALAASPEIKPTPTMTAEYKLDSAGNECVVVTASATFETISNSPACRVVKW